MSEPLKLVLVGAGSPTFTPFLFKKIVQSRLPQDRNLVVSLVDTDSKSLDQMFIVVQKAMMALRRKENGDTLRIEKHVDRRSALRDADFVVTTVGVGGMKATHADIEIPARHGISQPIGDTVGPGGIFRGLRHIPIVVDIAKDMQELCPGAVLFNYTNPMTAVVRAVNRETQIRAYGLCTSVWHTREFLAEHFKVPSRQVGLVVAGINHLGWILSLQVKHLSGRTSSVDDLFGRGLPGPRFGPICNELFRLFGYAPYAGDKHTAEFFPHLYNSERAIRRYHLYPNVLTVSDLKDREPVERLIRGVAAEEISPSVLLSRAGWEEEGIGVVDLIQGLTIRRKKIMFLGINLPNNDGAIANLPTWATVEVPAIVDRSGIRGHRIGELPKDIATILTTRLTEFEMLVDAALSGDKNLLLRILLMDGYTSSLQQAERLMEQMLRAERVWLPDFWFH